MKTAILILSVIFLVQVQAAFLGPATPKPNKPDFDFHVFASEWAGSICSINKCGKADVEGASTTFWNIHGLWPSDGKMGVNYCSDEKFDPKRVANQKEDLRTYWSGLYSSADAFHGHEWEKHGTCAKMTQEEYFKTTTELAKELDIYSLLHRNGIIPGGSYDCDRIAGIIRKEFEVNTISLLTKNGYLTELYLCLTKDDFKPTNCASGRICKGMIKYPEFKN